MAQQNTGLGWSAEQNYLVQSAAAVVAEIPAHIGGSSFPGQPLPVATTRLDVITNGFLLYEKTGLDNLRHKYYVASDTAGAVLVADMGSAPASSFIMYRCVTNINGARYYMADSANPDYFYEADLSTSVGSGFYSTPGNESTSGGGSDFALNPQLPAFPDINAFIAAIETATPTPITKTNAGYSVACYAQWYTQNGTELHSPILISSDSEFTEMSGPSGYNLATFNKLLSGVRFYMSFWDIPAAETIESSAPPVDLRQNGNLTLEQVFMYIVSTSYAHVIIINSPDPYEEQSGSSEEEGGDGEDIVDDDVDFTPLPSSMAVASGFITLFCPSQYELNQLANYMWSPLFDVDTFKKLFANPMDCILGLAVYPFPISPSGTKTVSVGGISTTVSMGYTLRQYWIVDCGSVYVPKQWGAYMDYAPYTKFNIFLPYIGFRPVSADDIMGKTISLRYMVDILSGACNAELKCGSTILYSWAGSCAAQIPITGNDWRSAITSGISIAGSIAATVLTQGASAPMITGTIASATVNSTQLKPEVQRSGAISGSSGFLAGQRPYLVRTNPRSAIPANQNKYSGYPSFVTILLGNLTGYNEVYSVHLENIPATGAELDEIESILKGGAIF